MTVMERSFMGKESHRSEPRERLAIYLRVQYRGMPAKLLAADLGCTAKAAENILNSHWPNSRHWAAIVRRFGRDVLAAVFEPEIDQTAARLYAEERELEERLQTKRALRRQVQGGGDSVPRLPAAVAAFEARP
jgi:hypothetical protein